MARGEASLQIVLAFSVLLVGVLLYQLVPQAGSASGAINDNINRTSQQPDNPLLPTPAASSTPTVENQALLSLTNILTALNVTLRLTATSLSHLVYLPKIIYTPLSYTTAILLHITNTLTRPLQPILAPLFLSIKIISTPVLVPLLLLYKFAVFVYPLYVFLGAAAICGASGGIIARRLGSAVIEGVLGSPKGGSQAVSVVKKEEETSPGRTRRLRVKAS